VAMRTSIDISCPFCHETLQILMGGPDQKRKKKKRWKRK